MNSELISYYEILDLTPDASSQEIREAYLRAKAAYSKDSVALYTLISPQEREEMLLKINEAYNTLSDVEKRKEYDRHQGFLSVEVPLTDSIAERSRAMNAHTPSTLNPNIISIDRVPPMENLAHAETFLVAPKMDISHSTLLPPSPPVNYPTEPVAQSRPPQDQIKVKDFALAEEISNEVEWRGPFLKKVREARRISIEELSKITKISKTYLSAIEEELFEKLPAPVFTRGFVTQFAKTLKLNHVPVVAAYMTRFQQAKADKNGP